MEFERFLNKYLNGSLSDQETEQFRLLLERFPHYREELRQILDLRSAIQDDALHLTPPEDLSETVRLAVGANFVNAKLGDRAIDERRRRVVWSPYRLAGVMAAIMAVAIPFGPEIFKGGIQKESAHVRDAVASLSVPSSRPSASAVASPANDVDRSSTEQSVAPTSVAAERVTQPSAPSGTIAAAITPAGRTSTESSGNGGGVSSEELPAEGGMSMGSSTFASNAVSLPAELSVQQGIFERSGLVNRDVQAMLKPRDVAFSNGYATAAESIDRVDDPMLAVVDQYHGPISATPGASDRLLTVGVTLGSGQVSNVKNATALLQNSYYFAVSVSKSDRVGIEMGASAFEQVKSVYSPSPSSSAKSSTDFTGFGKRSGTNDPGQTNASQLPTLSGGKSGITPRSDIMLPIGEYDPMIGSAESSYRSQNTHSSADGTQATLVEQRLEQQITYGALFYDRRLEISHDLDLCARLAFGGANDALVGGLRAYAAFSPTSTLTFTLGVGGSSLYDLTQHKIGASSNYGIYYGIETGF